MGGANSFYLQSRIKISALNIIIALLVVVPVIEIDYEIKFKEMFVLPI